jgi:hypothetical protein
VTYAQHVASFVKHNAGQIRVDVGSRQGEAIVARVELHVGIQNLPCCCVNRERRQRNCGFACGFSLPSVLTEEPEVLIGTNTFVTHVVTFHPRVGFNAQRWTTAVEAWRILPLPEGCFHHIFELGRRDPRTRGSPVAYGK